jgi:hypothetical protein
MVNWDNFFYKKHEDNNLLYLLRHDEIRESLAYMVDFKSHPSLKVTPYDYHIELSSKEITIAVIIYVGFETDYYPKLINIPNLQLVTFSKVLPTMYEFESLNVKFIDNLSLLFTVLARSENPLAKHLFMLKEYSG